MKKPTLLLALLVLFVLAPIQIESKEKKRRFEPISGCPVYVSYLIPWGLSTKRWESFLVIKYHNMTDKEIQGIKFGAVFFDAVGDPAKSPEVYVSSTKVKPGKSTTGQWSDWIWRDYFDNGVQIYVIKVLFSDGTSWEDDGSRACKWRRRP